MAEKLAQQARLSRLCTRFSRETGSNAVLKLSDLWRSLEISERTINEDIRVLRDELDAPLVYDRALRGWRFTRPFFIHQFELTQDQLAQIWIGIELMQRLGVLQENSGLEKAFQSLHYTAREKAQKAAETKQIYFDPFPKSDTSAYIPMFLHGIDEGLQLQFEYMPFHAPEPKSVVFDPWFLRFFDRRWYVGGFSHDPSEGFVRTFPLDRIVAPPTVLKAAPRKPSEFKASNYWQNIYGITIPPGAKPENVVLRFSTLQGKYFLSAPFYEPFQVLEQTDSYILIQMQIIINIELIRKLASYGTEVKVQEPQSLKDQLRQFFEDALA
jgi:predicted DNA-binding transcriptional regulator YafY